MGILPARSIRTFASSLSTQTTSLPLSAKHAPATSPTYPVPTTAIFIRFVSLRPVIVPCHRAHPRRLPARPARANGRGGIHPPVGTCLYDGASRRRDAALHELLEGSSGGGDRERDGRPRHRSAHPRSRLELSVAPGGVAASRKARRRPCRRAPAASAADARAPRRSGGHHPRSVLSDECPSDE